MPTRMQEGSEAAARLAGAARKQARINPGTEEPGSVAASTPQGATLHLIGAQVCLKVGSCSYASRSKCDNAVLCVRSSQRPGSS